MCLCFVSIITFNVTHAQKVYFSGAAPPVSRYAVD